MSVRRMLPFILINIVVSAVVVLAILYWWDGRDMVEQSEAAGNRNDVTPTFFAPVTDEQPVAPVTNTPEPQEGPLVHVVQAGDTLGNISRFYDVSLEDIVAANGISNPNVLSVGQQLVIPVGGLATATPPPTETPAADIPPTPIATEPVTGGDVIIEITTVTGIGRLADETVQITNRGSRQVALQDWKLADLHGHIYTFGQVTLFGDGAAIQVHTEAGRDGPADLYWGLEQAVWESGERVTLLDAEGNIQATYDIP